MIVNKELVLEYLSKWLADYLKEFGRSTFVVNDSGSFSDALLIDICSRATRIHGGLNLIVHPGVKQGEIGDYNYIKCYEIANDQNGIVVSPIDQTFGLYYRSYRKIDSALCDIFPFFDVQHSELLELYSSKNDSDYKLIETCNYAEKLYGIITSEDPPHKHPRWPYFVQEQKKWIATIHQREKKTRHKAIHKPFPIISDKPQLCRRVVQ